MYCMKRLVILFSCTAVLLAAADLASVRNVYILKMPRGLDQYLANHLTREHIFQVVTDPKLADTLVTDQIGEQFQAKFDELYPPPEPPEPPKPEKAEPTNKGDKGAKGSKEETAAENLPMMGDTVNKLSNPASSSSFGRARGVVFLVDAKSKQVVWSSYELPKDSSSKELDRTASDIVGRIKRDLKLK